ncbi:hypothetical protein Tco_0265994 [Tanacetum coccineum]
MKYNRLSSSEGSAVKPSALASCLHIQCILLSVHAILFSVMSGRYLLRMMILDLALFRVPSLELSGISIETFYDHLKPIFVINVTPVIESRTWELSTAPCTQYSLASHHRYAYGLVAGPDDHFQIVCLDRCRTLSLNIQSSPTIRLIGSLHFRRFDKRPAFFCRRYRRYSKSLLREILGPILSLFVAQFEILCLFARPVSWNALPISTYSEHNVVSVLPPLVELLSCGVGKNDGQFSGDAEYRHRFNSPVKMIRHSFEVCFSSVVIREDMFPVRSGKPPRQSTGTLMPNYPFPVLLLHTDMWEWTRRCTPVSILSDFLQQPFARYSASKLQPGVVRSDELKTTLEPSTEVCLGFGSVAALNAYIRDNVNQTCDCARAKFEIVIWRFKFASLYGEAAACSCPHDITNSNSTLLHLVSRALYTDCREGDVLDLRSAKGVSVQASVSHCIALLFVTIKTVGTSANPISYPERVDPDVSTPGYLNLILWSPWSQANGCGLWNWSLDESRLLSSLPSSNVMITHDDAHCPQCASPHIIIIVLRGSVGVTGSNAMDFCPIETWGLREYQHSFRASLQQEYDSFCSTTPFLPELSYRKRSFV